MENRPNRQVDAARSRRRNKFLTMDILFCSAVFLNAASVVYDRDYWIDAPTPFFVFLQVQLLLLILIVRVPLTTFSNKCVEASMIFLVLLLLVNTIVGQMWFSRLQKENEDFLTTPYYIEAVVLISIPVSIASLFAVILFVGLCLLFVEHRRQARRMHRRFEDDNVVDQDQQIDDIVETYMQMLQQVIYNQKGVNEIDKYSDCAICLKEFEQGEVLQRIPNCEHVFHEQCLRKWFRQLQICPMCRGNIIKLPSSHSQFQIASVVESRVQEIQFQVPQRDSSHLQNMLDEEEKENEGIDFARGSSDNLDSNFNNDKNALGGTSRSSQSNQMNFGSQDIDRRVNEQQIVNDVE